MSATESQRDQPKPNYAVATWTWTNTPTVADLSSTKEQTNRHLMKNYNLAIAILLTSFCLTACDAQKTTKTGRVKSTAPIHQTEKLEVKKRLTALDQATEAKKSITPASPPLQSQQIVRPQVVRPVSRPQPVDWQFNPQGAPQAQTQPSAPQFNPRAARQARIDAAVARGRALYEERQAQDAAAVGAGAARGMDRATDIFTPSPYRAGY